MPRPASNKPGEYGKPRAPRALRDGEARAEAGERDVREAPAGRAPRLQAGTAGERDAQSACDAGRPPVPDPASHNADACGRPHVGRAPELELAAGRKTRSRAGAAEALPQPQVAFEPQAFAARIRELAAPHWRELPWRRTSDPYLIWISEVMLQQTQVVRVQARWDDWLGRFSSVEALAAASDADVLAAWQGMGYNRRALALHRTAIEVVQRYGGVFPRGREALLALPGVGPSTAAGIRAFAFDEADVYLETNVRAVFIHELFPRLAEGEKVSDKALVPLVAAACPASGNDVRGWYYALLDYGAYLKKSVPNPTRKSGSYTRQSKFEGSLRQKRAELVRILLAANEQGVSLTTPQLEELLATEEQASGRPAPEPGLAGQILEALAREGFCHQDPATATWHIGTR